MQEPKEAMEKDCLFVCSPVLFSRLSYTSQVHLSRHGLPWALLIHVNKIKKMLQQLSTGLSDGDNSLVTPCSFQFTLVYIKLTKLTSTLNIKI